MLLCYIYYFFLGGFEAFKDKYPEWCEGSQATNECDPGQDNNDGELMGLRSLRISTPPTRSYSDSDSDSTCDSIGKQIFLVYNIHIYFFFRCTVKENHATAIYINE